MILFAVVVLMGAALGFVFKNARAIREEGHSTIAGILSLGSIGFFAMLLVILFPFLQWASNS